MIVLGLFLLVGSGLLTAAVVVQNTDPSSASAYGHAVSGLTVGGLFVAGVITGAVAILGVLMMLAGATRRRNRRAGLKRQVRAAHGEKESLAGENARLQGELEASRSGAAVYPAEDTTAGRHADDAETKTGQHGPLHR